MFPDTVYTVHRQSSFFFHFFFGFFLLPCCLLLLAAGWAFFIFHFSFFFFHYFHLQATSGQAVASKVIFSSTTRTTEKDSFFIFHFDLTSDLKLETVLLFWFDDRSSYCWLQYKVQINLTGYKFWLTHRTSIIEERLAPSNVSLIALDQFLPPSYLGGYDFVDTFIEPVECILYNAFSSKI
jgi:hypothetical protein